MAEDINQIKITNKISSNLYNKIDSNVVYPTEQKSHSLTFLQAFNIIPFMPRNIEGNPNSSQEGVYTFQFQVTTNMLGAAEIAGEIMSKYGNVSMFAPVLESKPSAKRAVGEKPDLTIRVREQEHKMNNITDLNILKALMENQGEVISIEELRKLGATKKITGLSVLACISRIRNIIEHDRKNPKFIKRVEKGYVFEDSDYQIGLGLNS